MNCFQTFQLYVVFSLSMDSVIVFILFGVDVRKFPEHTGTTDKLDKDFFYLLLNLLLLIKINESKIDLLDPWTTTLAELRSKSKTIAWDRETDVIKSWNKWLMNRDSVSINKNSNLSSPSEAGYHYLVKNDSFATKRLIYHHFLGFPKMFLNAQAKPISLNNGSSTIGWSLTDENSRFK